MNAHGPTDSNEMRELLDRLTRATPCGLYEYYLDESGSCRFTYFNEKFVEIFDATATGLENDASAVLQAFNPDDLVRVIRPDSEPGKEGGLSFVEARIVTPAGRAKWVQISSVATDSKIGDSVVWTGYCLDVTARKLDESKLESLMEAIPDLILLIDEDGRYLQANDSQYLRLFFPEDSSIIGKTMHEVFQKDVADNFLEFIRNAISSSGNHLIEYPLQAVSGEIYWFESRTRRLNETFNGKRVTLSAVRDITEKNRAKEELVAAERKLLKAAVEETKSQERALLMKDMHDGLGSQLTYARMMIESKRIDQPGLLEIVQECIADLYLIIDTLSEDSSSFHDAVIDFRYRIQKRFDSGPTQIHWRLSLDHVPHVQQRVTLQVLRIMQEALNNSLRHGKAQSITISAVFDASDGHLMISVGDDGIGFTSDAAQGRGLANMKKRARDIGAAFEIKSTPGGTQVHLRMKP